MRCNEKSFVKLTEASIQNGTLEEYVCYEELYELFDVCSTRHFRYLIEMYYFRAYHNYIKPISHQRSHRRKDGYLKPEFSKKLYY